MQDGTRFWRRCPTVGVRPAVRLLRLGERSIRLATNPGEEEPWVGERGIEQGGARDTPRVADVVGVALFFGTSH